MVRLILRRLIIMNVEKHLKVTGTSEVSWKDAIIEVHSTENCLAIFAVEQK